LLRYSQQGAGAAARVMEGPPQTMRVTPVSFPAVEQRPPRWNELEQQIVVADIRGQHHQAELVCLQKHHAVVKGTQLAVLPVPLKAAQNPRQQRRPPEDIGIGRKDPMWRHGFDLLAYLQDHTRGSRIGRAEDTNRMHQFLDRYGRVIDLPLRNQIVKYLRRTILHLIDVDAGVEQEPLPADQVRIDEWQLFIAPPGQRPLRIKSRPASGGVEIERHHLRSRASTLDRSCPWTP
jgi:hypothetical protein